ncbi:hypothetical protein [Thalassobacillus sp. CUG 92003]|uniref:hypothetical protein n=1 Tax=Thalassobacillus sp. CUG 92003 TaxID=2736641 RepID=UPI0015E6EDB1|nr:hypothetical protein [Thalassobacillus sp. CUG 92003]
MSIKVVGLVEPSFYGVKYVKATYEQGYKVVVLASSKENPIKYGYEELYRDLIIADIRDEESIWRAIQESQYKDELTALIPVTDFALHITSKLGCCTLLQT